MTAYSRSAGAAHITEVQTRIRLLKRQLAPYITQFSSEEGILWQQALAFQRQRRYRAAEIVLQQLQGTLLR